MHLIGVCGVLSICRFCTTAFWLANVMLFLQLELVHILNNTMFRSQGFDFFQNENNQNLSCVQSCRYCQEGLLILL